MAFLQLDLHCVVCEETLVVECAEFVHAKFVRELDGPESPF